jgi:hypothetical protein
MVSLLYIYNFRYGVDYFKNQSVYNLSTQYSKKLITAINSVFTTEQIYKSLSNTLYLNNFINMYNTSFGFISYFGDQSPNLSLLTQPSYILNRSGSGISISSSQAMYFKLIYQSLSFEDLNLAFFPTNSSFMHVCFSTILLNQLVNETLTQMMTRLGLVFVAGPGTVNTAGATITLSGSVVAAIINIQADYNIPLFKSGNPFYVYFVLTKNVTNQNLADAAFTTSVQTTVDQTTSSLLLNDTTKHYKYNLGSRLILQSYSIFTRQWGAFNINPQTVNTPDLSTVTVLITNSSNNTAATTQTIGLPTTGVPNQTVLKSYSYYQNYGHGTEDMYFNTTPYILSFVSPTIFITPIEIEREYINNVTCIISGFLHVIYFSSSNIRAIITTPAAIQKRQFHEIYIPFNTSRTNGTNRITLFTYEIEASGLFYINGFPIGNFGAATAASIIPLLNIDSSAYNNNGRFVNANSYNSALIYAQNTKPPRSLSVSSFNYYETTGNESTSFYYNETRLNREYFSGPNDGLNYNIMLGQLLLTKNCSIRLPYSLHSLTNPDSTYNTYIFILGTNINQFTYYESLFPITQLISQFEVNYIFDGNIQNLITKVVEMGGIAIKIEPLKNLQVNQLANGNNNIYIYI